METKALVTDERLQFSLAAEDEQQSLISEMAGDDHEKVIKPLWPVKLHYFLHGAGGAPIFPFLAVFLKQKGMSGPELGTCFAGIQLISLVARPFIGGLMDKHPHHKQAIFCVLFLVHLLGFTSLWYLPPIHDEDPVFNIKCNHDNPFSFNISIDHVKDPCVVEKLQERYKKIDVEWTCGSGAQKMMYHSVLKGEQVSSIGQTVTLPFELKSSLTSSNPLCKKDCSPLARDRALQEWLGLVGIDNGSSLVLTTAFLMALTTLVVGGVAGGAVNSFQDAMCQQLLKSQPAHRQESYGQQRLFASIGWGLSALVVGRLLDAASKGKLLYDYDWSFTIMALAWTLDFVVLINMDFSVGAKTKSSSSSMPSPSVSSVWSILARRQTMLFLLFCAIAGVCYGTMPYHFLLLEELGSNMSCEDSKDLKLLQGLCLTFNCIGEVPVFFYSGHLLSKLGSQRVMSIPLVVFALRFLFYSSLTSPWPTLVVEPLNGICTGLVFSVLTVHANELAPKGMATTMVAIAFVVMEGIGNAGGGMMAGKLYSTHGAAVLFQRFGIFVIIATTLLIVLQRRSGRLR